MGRPPRYVQQFTDRHGHARFYFRRPGSPRVPLPGLPWSPQFMAAYEAASNDTPKVEIGATRIKAGTINALAAAFYQSTEFQGWSAETRRTRRNILERFRVEHGDKTVANLEPRHVANMVAAKSSTPAAAKNFAKTLSALMKFAVAQGLRRDNPVIGVATPKLRGGGFQTWDEDHIAAFEAKHAIGTRARLAFALLLYTAQRRGDVVRMGKQHIRNGMLSVRQNKTGATLEIPVHSELQKIVDATPGDHLTFLTTSTGAQFTSAGFGNLFRDWCNEAGLSRGLSAHGLRKAACRRLAEAGCSANQIMSISGHKSLAEAQKYVVAADQKRLAKSAMATVSEAFRRDQIRNLACQT
jgi:integrase